MDADLLPPESTMDAPRRSMQRLVREFVDALLQDCMELMAGFPDGYFDLAIVDPPYGIGAGGSFGRYWDSTLGKPAPAAVRNKAKDWDKAIPGADYWRELFRVSKHQIKETMRARLLALMEEGALHKSPIANRKS